jgi:hypothetical protein
MMEKLDCALEMPGSTTQVIKSEKEKLNCATKIPDTVRKVQVYMVNTPKNVPNCHVIGRNVRWSKNTQPLIHANER